MSSGRESLSRGEVLQKLQELRGFAGDPPAFWLRLAELSLTLSGGIRSRVVVKLEKGWSVLASAPEGRAHPKGFWQEEFDQQAGVVLARGEPQTVSNEGSGQVHYFLPLILAETRQPCLLEIVGEPNEASFTEDTLLPLLADAPAVYQRHRNALQWKNESERMAKALDLLAVVNAHHRFQPAAMALVNEVVQRLGAERVTLGWLARPYVKVVAVSGTERFQRKMQVLQQLEAAMEECRDQDEEILFPEGLEQETVTRDHAEYAKQAGNGCLVSVPLRHENEVVGVLTVERETHPFVEAEVLALRVIGDQLTPRLHDLRLQSRWFGYRWAQSWRRGAAWAVGSRHTWWKVAAIVAALVLAFALFVSFPYRASSTLLVRSESMAHLTAPFEGYIAGSQVRPGDLVEAGQVLASLDDRDLLIEQAEVLAEIRRYQAEAELAEAEGRLADLRVARASRAQSEARLQLLEHRLSRSELRAPFTGVVVQGDLRERIGSPTSPGDVLLQVSELAGLYLEIRLPERDIDLIEGFETGRVVFSSRPDVKFPFRIEQVSPAAYPDGEGNAFVLRAHLEESADWLRPGMSGVAKIDAGNRTLAWRATHRIVDFLRMRFWW
ncbi:MAG: efflux RND transporter periplasmic adaptor subunit [Opitutales bacterium]|nr:efflux RND transporter periplasmic adaptor subunit [Opitutales bacterium]